MGKRVRIVYVYELYMLYEKVWKLYIERNSAQKKAPLDKST